MKPDGTPTQPLLPCTLPHNLPCNRQHYSCPIYHRWNGDKTANWAFGSLGFTVVAFIVVSLAVLFWTHVVTPAPESAAQIQARSKSNQTALAQHIAECQKVGDYWDEEDNQCTRP